MSRDEAGIMKKTKEYTDILRFFYNAQRRRRLIGAGYVVLSTYALVCQG